jgi:type VI protein secretion system component VasF
MTTTTNRGLAEAAVVSLGVGALSLPNLLQSLITAISSFFPLLLMVLLSLWGFRVARWSPQRQRIFTWAVALGFGAFMVLFPFGLARLL